MASALLLNGSVVLQNILSSHTKQAGNPRPFNLLLPRHYLAAPTLAFSRRPNRNSAPSTSKKKKKTSRSNYDTDEGDDLDVDAIEALFSMTEEDLKHEDATVVGDQDDDDISEEDLEKLQRQLEVASGFDFDDEDDQDVEVLNSSHAEFSNDNVIQEEDDDEEEEDGEEMPVKLKNWQLRGLAKALKTGKRKTRIKSLAAELCLDRAIVLDLLRNPPPNLVMMSAALPDEPEPAPLIPESKLIFPPETTRDAEKSTAKVEVPIHEILRKRNAQKRLKKAHIETLEKVYYRTRRPTNTMICSIMQVTNLPRKRVIQWFEDKRTEEGAPEHYLPYRRSVPETVASRGNK